MQKNLPFSNPHTVQRKTVWQMVLNSWCDFLLPWEGVNKTNGGFLSQETFWFERKIESWKSVILSRRIKQFEIFAVLWITVFVNWRSLSRTACVSEESYPCKEIIILNSHHFMTKNDLSCDFLPDVLKRSQSKKKTKPWLYFLSGCATSGCASAGRVPSLNPAQKTWAATMY